jgi:hypothetical protein
LFSHEPTPLQSSDASRQTCCCEICATVFIGDADFAAQRTP